MANKYIEKLLIQALEVSYITCPKCHSNIEPDAKKCECGWKNILRTTGLI